MKQSFDAAAITYDTDFTDTNIGKLLRQIVWSYMKKVTAGSQELNILELNCGTGEDALFFARHGHKITATDVSEEMVRITNNKVEHNGHEQNVSCYVKDIRDIKDVPRSSNYDLVFSNFGGLNCLNRFELDSLAVNLGHLMKPGGRFIAVVMPRFCLWESFYFLSKFDFKKMFRRNKSTRSEVDVKGEPVNTWYYSPGKFEHIFRSGFKKVKLKPLGTFLPPSYTEPFFRKNLSLLNAMNEMEKVTSDIPAMAWLSDHFIIDLQTR